MPIQNLTLFPYGGAPQFTLQSGSGYRSSSISAFLNDDDEMRTGTLHTRMEGASSCRMSLSEDVGNILIRFGAESGTARSPAEASTKTSSAKQGRPPSSPAAAAAASKRSSSRKQRINARSSSPLRPPRTGNSERLLQQQQQQHAAGKPNKIHVPTFPRGEQKQRGQRPTQQRRAASLTQALPTRERELSMFSTTTAAWMMPSRIPSRATSMISCRGRTAASRERRRPSFIKSITVCDDRPWQPPNIITKKVQPASSRKAKLALNPLQHHAARRLLTDDVPAFKDGFTDMSSRRSPKPSKEATQSTVNRMAFSVPYSDIHASAASYSQPDFCDVTTIAARVGSTLVQPLSTCREKLSNVFLPDAGLREEQQGEVWRVCSSVVDDESNRTEWMRPLQESASAKERAAPLTDNDAARHHHHHHHHQLCDYQSLHSLNDDYHSIFRGVRCRHRHHGTPHPSVDCTDGARSGAAEKPNKSLAARSALLRQPQQLLDNQILATSATLSLTPCRFDGEWRKVSTADASAVSFLQPAAQQEAEFVKLSHAAQVLYAALLYMRTLGGFPTLLRIIPLTVNSDVVEKEHCVELVFSSATATAIASATFDTVKGHDNDDSSVALRHLSNALHQLQCTPSREIPSVRRSADAAERRIVVRSILAEKCVVERFGLQEVVHVLPPLQDATVTAGNQEMMVTQTLGSGNSTVERLPQDTGAPIAVPGAAPFMRHSVSLQRSEVGAKREPNHGDIAVAFLMSAEASKLCAVPPEPMDLEALRYKVYALKGQEAGGHAQMGMGGALLGTAAFQEKPQQVTRRNSFELELKKIMGNAPAEPSSCDRAPEMRTMPLRFPPYYPVTVAESTLSMTDASNATFGGDRKNGGCVPPTFPQLRLPQLHADLVVAMQYVLEERAGLTEEKSVGSSRF